MGNFAINRSNTSFLKQVRIVALIISWVTCLGFAIQRGHHSWVHFNEYPETEEERNKKQEEQTESEEARQDEEVPRRSLLPRDPFDKVRKDGNHGHTYIDFGQQWVMGRMVVKGNTHCLYDRRRLWPVVWEGFPVEDESDHQRRNSFPPSNRDPDTSQTPHDAENMMTWLMGHDSPYWDKTGEAISLSFCSDMSAPNPFADVARISMTRNLLIPDAEADRANLTALAGVLSADTYCGNPYAIAPHAAHAIEVMRPNLREEVGRPAIGGPLYPPIHGFLYSPLGMIDRPQNAYRAMQIVSMLLAFTGGFGVHVLTRGRIWWPLATSVILIFPGFRSGLDLAQNSIFTLNILIWGWALASRNRNIAGGIVWGFLAYKPVWAATFFLAPLLLGRLRFCLAMGMTGVTLIGLTLPFTGVQGWLDWLKVGKEASNLYCVNKNWIELSRDLFGIPRRFLLDFSRDEANRPNVYADQLGWLLWGFVLTITVFIRLVRGNSRSLTSQTAAFVLFGSYLTCYRFMYYDALLAAFPMLVLFSCFKGPRHSLLSSIIATVVSHLPLLLLITSLFVLENWFMHSGHSGTVSIDEIAAIRDPRWDPETSSKVTFEPSVYNAWDTVILMLIWGWCGLRILIEGDQDSTASDGSS